MWIADALTLARVPLAILVALTYGNLAWSITFVALAALTDALDGRVARAARQRHGIPREAPSRGDWLDPIADKVFVVIVLGAILAHEPGTWLVLGLVAARELVLVPLAAAYVLLHRRPTHRLRAAPIGKVATIIQFFAIAAVFVAPAHAATLALASAAALTGLAAAVQYAADT